MRIPIVGVMLEKSNRFVAVPYAIDTENFVEIRPQISELSCSHTEVSTSPFPVSGIKNYAQMQSQHDL